MPSPFAFELAAFLEGVASLVAKVADDPASVGVRPGNNGSPLGAYRGGGWYYGVYFAGLGGAWGQSQESYSVTLSAGVDITRVWTRGPTKDAGAWFLKAGELYERAAYLAELLMNAQGSVVARACQAQLTALYGVGNEPGLFREHFDRLTFPAPREQAPERWLLAEPGEDAPVCYVCSLVFSGLKYHKLLSELPT